MTAAQGVARFGQKLGLPQGSLSGSRRHRLGLGKGARVLSDQVVDRRELGSEGLDCEVDAPWPGDPRLGFPQDTFTAAIQMGLPTVAPTQSHQLAARASSRTPADRRSPVKSPLAGLRIWVAGPRTPPRAHRHMSALCGCPLWDPSRIRRLSGLADDTMTRQ